MQKRTLLALTALLLLLLSGEQGQATPAKDSLSMEIIQIIPRMSSDKSRTRAVLEIKFSNLSASAIRVPFATVSGKGIDILKTRNTFVITDKPSSASQAGEFATVLYSWSKDGTPITSRVYDLTHDALHLEEHGSCSILIPLEIPSQSGTFDLSISLDNRSLENVIRTNNSSLVNERVLSAPNVYFHSQAGAKITIPSEFFI